MLISDFKRYLLRTDRVLIVDELRRFISGGKVHGRGCGVDMMLA